MKYLNDESKKALELFCWNRITTDRRNACMILLTLTAGPRATELLNLTWKTLSPCKVRFKTLKRGKNREVFISEALYAELLLLRAEQDRDDDRIFKISYQRFYQIWNEWKATPNTIHGLRHTFAMSVYDRTKDLRMVQKLLGHKSLASTAVYLEKEFSDNELKNAVGV